MDAPPDWWKTFFSGLVVDFWRSALPAEVTRAEADYLEAGLGLTPGSRVLDVPCGHGRIAVELAARGCRVTGIDISGELLDAAREDARARGVSVTWREGDMRELPWEEEFDAAFSAGSSFGFFGEDAEDSRFLRAVARSLAPGGRFALDGSKVAESILPAFTERHDFERGGLRFEAENRYDVARGRIENRYTITRGVESETKLASHRVYTVSQLLAMLTDAGLETTAIHGSTGAEPYRLGSRQLFVLCRKRA
jgi:SAM-dependent methyltransferase